MYASSAGGSAPARWGAARSAAPGTAWLKKWLPPLAPASATHSVTGLGGRSQPRRALAEISGDVDERLPLSIGEFARVLGGGVVPGSVVLIGGDPGIGKSTLLLQVALEMAAQVPGAVCLWRGVRAPDQDARALRLLRMQQSDATTPWLADAHGTIPDDLFLVTETNLDVILEHIQTVKPQPGDPRFGANHLSTRAGHICRLGHPGA